MSFGLQEKLIAIPPQMPRIRGQRFVRWVANTVIRCSSWRTDGSDSFSSSSG